MYSKLHTSCIVLLLNIDTRKCTYLFCIKNYTYTQYVLNCINVLSNTVKHCPAGIYFVQIIVFIFFCFIIF